MKKLTAVKRLKLFRDGRSRTVLIWVAGFAVIGVITLLFVKAATPYVSVEPENSNPTTPATIVDDTTASGGKYIKFGTAQSQGPITAPLKASIQNPHYFVDGNGKAVVLTGSHTWNNFQDWGTNGSIQTMDFNAYVNMLTANHHSFTLIWNTELPHFCNLPTISDTGGNPAFDVDIMPWQRTGPGTATDGKPKFDLTKFNQAFFDRLHSRVQQLNQAGIYAGVYTFTGEWLNLFRCSDGYPLGGSNNINGITDGAGSVGAITMTAPNAVTNTQDAYLDKLVDTLNDLPNVLWATSEEAPPTSEWWNNHVIDHIKAYEKTKPFQHPVGYGTFINTSDSQMTTTNADWMAPLSQISASSSCGSGTPSCKVNINDSDHGYFGMWNLTVQQNRNFIWDNFMNGSQALFMDPYEVYYPRQGRNMCGNPVNGICSSPDNRYASMRANMGYTRLYGDRMNLVASTPSDTRASTGNCLFVNSATNPEYLVYSDNGGSFTVNLSGSTKSLAVEWLNPSTGVTTMGTNVTAGSTSQSFTPPFSGDAVLYLH